MLAHMFHHAVDITEEADVAQLVYFVVSDGLELQRVHEIDHVVRAGGHGGNAAAGEGDFGSGGKLVNQIGIAGTLALGQDLDQVILTVIIEMMHTVGVIPEDPEVGSGRLQPGKTADRFIRIGDAGRIGVFRYAPDALDGFVFADQFFHDVHIRTGGSHRDGDHLDAEVFRDGKMTVITGHRAEELHLRQLAPGGVAHDTVGPDTGNGVKHDVQGGVSVDDDVFGVVLHHVAQKLAGFLNAGQLAVVPAVCTVFTGQIGRRIQNVHHMHGKIQLIQAGNTPAHIQLHVHGLDFFILFFQSVQFLCQFFRSHLHIRLHDEHPSFGKRSKDTLSQTPGVFKRRDVFLMASLQGVPGVSFPGSGGS